ncbi:diguanylate cyclase [Vogesella sp. LIG4]|uniref:sensor domain-containing diguanylate cyclase n=1 Tax=Vogesella sp. LIG4 TaxID=1192162 RepID=UPI00081FE071|nr:diguanylate cyclase [Vogesella sp. LIG4]SCK28681.1 diguanylate cyclase (GGDEF) domain-containing protein [Vogesella sp. LIG4]
MTLSEDLSLPVVPEMADAYHSVSFRRLWRNGTRLQQSTFLLAWLVCTSLSVGLGLASVIHAWSGLPLSYGGVELYISIYPPILICTWWALCFGWFWGALPAYLSTLSLALYAGMPWYWALLFACGNPVGLGVMVLGYRAIAMPCSLYSWRALVFFLQMAFVGCMFSSSAALVWCYTNKVDQVALFAIWQGWWLGNFLQNIFLVVPIMALTWPRVEAWLECHQQLLSVQPTESRKLVLRLMGVLIISVLIYAFTTIWLGTESVQAQLHSGQIDKLSHAADRLSGMIWAFFWVIAFIALFMGMFGYQMFLHWHRTNTALLEQLGQANADLAEQARTDGLTGLANRQSTNRALADCWHNSRLRGERAALLMLDIDLFKRINDDYGHVAGDRAIRTVAALLRHEVRSSDLAGRFGGEEFVLLLRRCELSTALEVAERIRQRVEQAIIDGEHDPSLRVTVSIGVAMAQRDDSDAEHWLRRADEALYQAKRQGRNRVIQAA